jgi:anhydro-N-acetylmuramic acid kinase
MDIFRVLGLMSGTSLDGLDIAQCKFEFRDNRWHYLIERAFTYLYSSLWKEKLSNAENLSGLDLMLLNNEFGIFMGHCVNDFRKKDHVNIDFVASHGQTIFHQPQSGLTLQIGNGAHIAATTGLSTICDFRTLDVAMGGQGAPLVPIGDKLLFNEYDYCLNLGGFANISYDDQDNNRIAYDICPVNIIINHFVKERGLSYDPEGSIAHKGNVDEQLLLELNQLEFYKEAGPKSLGKEWITKVVIPVINKYHLSLEDTLRTYYQHIVEQLNEVLKSYLPQKKTVLITGGGAHNVFLINLLKNNLSVELIIPSKEVIDFKEALIFAFLGILRYLEEANCLSSVTGATQDNIGGVIYLYK